MALAKSTIVRLRSASKREGGKIYEESEDALDEDVTHFDEDDDPLSNVGDVEDKEGDS